MQFREWGSGSTLLFSSRVPLSSWSSKSARITILLPDQVVDYALDLKNFHEQSHDLRFVPVVVATNAKSINDALIPGTDGVLAPLRANRDNLGDILSRIAVNDPSTGIDPSAWCESIYKPTPTIIEAAQALYRGHNVKEIARSDAGAINLSLTTQAIAEAIEDARALNQKTICFVTGVPGAGKTLAGLNIANEHLQTNGDEHAVFLSGNGPLVAVLREALARGATDGAGEAGGVSKRTALRRAQTFVQNIHHFRDEALRTSTPPLERVVIFDEAQRAWTLNQTASFMKTKRNVDDFAMSEPQFLIS